MNQKKTIRAARRQIRMRKLRRFMRNRMAVAGVAVILVILLLCVLAPLLTPYDPETCPCLQYILWEQTAWAGICGPVCFTAAGFPF